MEIAPREEFEAWLRQFLALARRSGISQATLAAAMDGVGPDPDVRAHDRDQVEVRRTLPEYLAAAVSLARIERGKEALTAQASPIRRIEAAFGVGGAILTAIWGMESNYGDQRGGHDVATALATLAHQGRRRMLFEEQLLALLRIVQSGRSRRCRFDGSWAGAMGHTQLLPTTWEAAAVDFDGDGCADVWAEDPADALASTANVLHLGGWQPGLPALVRAELPAQPNWQELVPGAVATADTWRARGLVCDTNAGKLALSIPFGAAGPVFLCTPNFQALMRYNRSEPYALAVVLLAAEIAGEPLLAAMPEGTDVPGHDAIREAQGHLVRLGYDTGGTDGLCGPATRQALRRFQLERGLPGDGFPSRVTLDALRETKGQK